MRSSLGVSLLFVLFAITGCARLGAEGEACSSPGVSESEYAGGYGGDCESGLICAPDRSASVEYTSFSTASCRARCASSADCAEGFTCRGVSGAETSMACLPVAAD